MAYDFSSFKNNSKEVIDWLSREYAGIRTGRATPAILDGVSVEAYGSFMKIRDVANISVEDARMMRISPWDMGLTKAIEKAIQTSDLGLSVAVDDKGIRVNFPDLTSDRRTSLIKIAKQKLEDARVTLRGDREKVLKDIDKKEKDGEMGEDEKFRLRNELQKLVDETGAYLESLFEKKEKEIAE